MASTAIAAARPRTSGEILDDAWRLYFAEIPALLLLSGAFLAPVFAAVLLLLASPTIANSLERWLYAAGIALLATATGLGSASCQEFLRRRSEQGSVGIAVCVGAALRRAGGHLAVRAGALGLCLIGAFGFVPLLAGANPASATFAALVGTGYLLLPAAVLWTVSAPAHAVLANENRPASLFAEISRPARLDAPKAAVVTLSRVLVLAMAFFNLHLLLCVGLWVAMNLGGFDLALASAQVSVQNPLYDVALAMLCWLLLAPYFEASNYLLYLDARTRQEGLDLLQRVRRVFPAAGKTGALLVPIAVVLFAPGPVYAAEGWPAAVREAKSRIDAIATEIAAADPYPGSARWEPRLRAAAKTLAQAAKDARERRTAALVQGALAGFSGHKQAEAVRVLREIGERLDLVEEALPPQDGGPANDQPQRSQSEIRKLVRPLKEDSDAPPDKQPPEREEPKPRDVQRDVRMPVEPSGEEPVAGVDLPRGTGTFLGALSLGLLLAVMAVAIVRLRMSLPKAAAKSPNGPVAQTAASAFPRPDEQPSDLLWKQAEDLANAGRQREAVRALYLAVLSLLHSQRLLRYETTRTNGEYVRQVRLAANAPPGVSEPFEQLTRQFEVVWYGSGASTQDEFQACHNLAQGVRALAQS